MRSCKKTHGGLFGIGPNKISIYHNNASNDSRYGWLRYDQCHCSNIHQVVMTSHMMQLKQEYKKLVENFNCDIQEFVMVQEDPPALPSDTLHLPPLHCLHSATTRNMELPQSGELRTQYLSPKRRTDAFGPGSSQN